MEAGEEMIKSHNKLINCSDAASVTIKGHNNRIHSTHTQSLNIIGHNNTLNAELLYNLTVIGHHNLIESDSVQSLILDGHNNTGNFNWLNNQQIDGANNKIVNSHSRINPFEGLVTEPRQPGSKKKVETGECAVCMNTRALVVFVHGDTGHQCCCNDCAKDLKNSNQPCPI